MLCTNPGCQVCNKDDGKISKEEFQNCGHVVNFVEWLVQQNIYNTSLKGNLNSLCKPLKEWACEYRHDKCGFDNWCKDAKFFIKRKNNLVKAIWNKCHQKAFDEAKCILSWGYSNSKNACDCDQVKQVQWVFPQRNLISDSLDEHRNAQNLCDALRNMNCDISELLRSNYKKISEVLKKYNKQNMTQPSNEFLSEKNKNNNFKPYYMTVGISKIFAFLNCEGFIIYDSRVARTLIRLIEIWLKQRILLIKLYPKQRNLLIKIYQKRYMVPVRQKRPPAILKFENPNEINNNRSKKLFIYNIKASWLVEMIRKRVYGTFDLPCDCEKIKEIKCLEGCYNKDKYKKCQVKYHQILQTRAIESAFSFLDTISTALESAKPGWA